MSAILMLVINPMVADTRVEKQAQALTAAGYTVTVVGTLAEGLPTDEGRDGYRIVRLPYRRPLKDSITAPYNRASARRRGCRDAATVGKKAGLRPHLLWDRVVEVVVLAATRGWLLAGGAALKTIRSRSLTFEYWSGLARRLPGIVERPDIITAHDLGPLYSAQRLADAWGRSGVSPKVVYDSHELYVEQQTRWTRREKLSWRVHEKRFIRRADLVTTVSPGIAQVLQERYRLRERPLVILNSPSLGQGSSQDETADVRADIGGIAETLAVYVGGAKPGRGVHLLVPALAATPGWHLALVGSGSNRYVDELLENAQRLGVLARVHRLPERPASELPAYLRSADVGVHPMEPTCLNHEFALPNKLFDYLFAGLPVAVTSLREMGSLVRRHGLGTTFDPHDPRKAAEAILAASLQEPPVCSRAMLEAWSWERQAETLVAAYERLGQPSG